MIILGDKEYYKGIGTINFEGKDSDNPLAFKYYNPDQIVAGKTMREHFKFAVSYWYSFGNNGADFYGMGTQKLLWNELREPIQAAKNRADAAFEFISKMGFDYFCFHDCDLVQEGQTFAQTELRLATMTEYLKEKKAASGIKVLWGTADCFSNSRYMNGAATNPDFKVVARAAGQVKLAIDASIALEAENHLFWGGREGYLTLLNTDMKRELDHMGQFLNKARDYAREQGFKGNLLLEPKPMEPSKHQYDFDAATTIGFLRQYGLEKDFKLNIEANHATLAQHTFQHELEVAANAGMLGSIDANRGDCQNSWDTSQFPNNIQDVTEAMLIFLKAGGVQGGGINFDAKIRRNSTDLEDIFHAHIGGADVFARALLTADKIITSSPYETLRKQRYSSFDTGKGKEFEEGKINFKELYAIAKENDEPELQSGKQELFENIINRYI